MRTTMEGAPQVRQVEALTPATLAMLGDLVAQSGWNQTGDDWGVFWRHGSIAVVRDAGERIVASGAVLPLGLDAHGQSVAWISMILVMPSERGHGLGRAVFEHCLRSAQAAGHVPMLDATPQGEPLYRQFGFEPAWRLARWRREAVGASAVPLAESAGSMDELVRLDARALGFARPVLLGDLRDRRDSHLVHRAGAVGLVRAGRVAQHIGPLLAEEEGAAIEWLRSVAAGVAGPVVIDVPSGGAALASALAEIGFARQRDFTRMGLAARGRPLPHGEPSLLHAVAGPEFG